MTEEERYDLDHLNLSNDKHLLSLFRSLSLDSYLKDAAVPTDQFAGDESEDIKGRFNEEVKYSSECEILSFDYTTGTVKAKAEVVLVLSSRALYLFPPMVSVSAQEQEDEEEAMRKKTYLVYNSFDRFLVEEIALLSLPYSSAVGSNPQSDVAMRTEDFALHMHNFQTLWIRAPNGRRSEIAQMIAEVFAGVVGGIDLDLNHCDYKELVQWIADSTIRGYVTQVKCLHFTKQPALFQGWMSMAMFKAENYSTLPLNQISSKLSLWQTRWFYLSRHDLWHFANGEEVESYKFALAAPKNKRANLPKFGRISLSKETEPQEVTLGDGTVCVELDCDDIKFLFFPATALGARESVKAWINAIRERKILLH
jgi:hypothetical protein